MSSAILTEIRSCNRMLMAHANSRYCAREVCVRPIPSYASQKVHKKLSGKSMFSNSPSVITPTTTTTITFICRYFYINVLLMILKEFSLNLGDRAFEITIKRTLSRLCTCASSDNSNCFLANRNKRNTTRSTFQI